MDNDPHSTIDPTPEEIAEACARIREAWSVDEHSRRRDFQPLLSYADPTVETAARFWASQRAVARVASRSAV